MDLETLIRERERQPRGSREAARLDQLVAAAATELGLGQDELKGLEAALLAERQDNPVAAPATGQDAADYVIIAPERAILPAIAVMLAVIVTMMDQPWGGLALVGVAVMLVVLPRRVRRFTVVGDRLRLGGHAHALDFQRVVEVDVARREPRWGSSLHKAAKASLKITLRLDSGQVIRFARGMYFQRRPIRRPLDLVFMPRFVERLCKSAGLSIRRTDAGFVATRLAKPGQHAEMGR